MLGIAATVLAITVSKLLILQRKEWTPKRDMLENKIEKTIFQGIILSRPMPAEHSNTYFIVTVEMKNIKFEEKVIVHWTDFTKHPSDFEPGNPIYFTSIFIAASRTQGFYGYLDPSNVNPQKVKTEYN